MPLLSRDRIVAQAQETIERRGYEALSLRGLAASLDVTAPALYDHVQSSPGTPGPWSAGRAATRPFWTSRAAFAGSSRG
jgi:hypothetical protein